MVRCLKVLAQLDPVMLKFSRATGVLVPSGDDLAFSHQLLQEYLAAQVLLDSARSGESPRRYWPAERWWQGSGWEVVADIAAERLRLSSEPPTLAAFIVWLGQAKPGLASDIWLRQERPALSGPDLQRLREQWFERMTDPEREPDPAGIQARIAEH